MVFPHKFFPMYDWGDIVKKRLPKVGGVEKVFKRGNGHIRGGFL